MTTVLGVPPDDFRSDNEEAYGGNDDYPLVSRVVVDGAVTTRVMSRVSGASLRRVIPSGEYWLLAPEDVRRASVKLLVTSGTLAIGFTEQEGRNLDGLFQVGTGIVVDIGHREQVWGGAVGGATTVSVMVEHWSI